MENVNLGDVILRPEKAVAIRRRIETLGDIFHTNDQVIEVGFDNGQWLEIDRMHWGGGMAFLPRVSDSAELEEMMEKTDRANRQMEEACLARYAEFCEKLGFT